MNLIIAVEDRMGMAFNRRRVSRDQEVLTRILDLIGDHPLVLNAYSAKLFPDTSSLKVSENPFEDALPDEYCLLENLPVPAETKEVQRLYLFRWNRTYPSDLKLNLGLQSPEWKPESSEEFSGKSHEKITLEVYVHEKD